ncbi:MAG: mannose-6-phosphate isomerase, class I [Acidimicrobiales bacterium]|nr:mannose-6-phosphate isomerase, class I [Acidimicrobiales bacterium]
MELLSGFVQHYHWGSTHALAALENRPPAATPEAEKWFGTHPDGPTTLATDATTTLADAVSQANETLPYLVKFLAADQPLSLQTHPNAAQAADPSLNFGDPQAKPEIVCALTPFEVLCGFQPPNQAQKNAADYELPHKLQNLLSQPDGCKATVAAVLASTWKTETAALIARCRQRTEPLAKAILDLAAFYPTDPALLLVPLMEHHILQPGQALYLSPGVLHAYLGGLALETMGPSDNVVRAGFTSKKVDPTTLLAIIETAETPQVQNPANPVYQYQTGEAFTLQRLQQTELTVDTQRSGDLVVATFGTTTLTVNGQQLALTAGNVAWVPQSDGPYQLATDGEAFRVSSPAG